jgi:hypothetical protein
LLLGTKRLADIRSSLLQPQSMGALSSTSGSSQTIGVSLLVSGVYPEVLSGALRVTDQVTG